MQVVYPAILTREGSAFLIYIPDVKSGVKGGTLFEAMQCARHALSKMKTLPDPSDLRTAIAKAVSVGNFVSPDVSMTTGNPISVEYIYIDVDTDIAY